MREGITKQVAQTIAQYDMLDSSGKHLVALSGGADSVALLHILLQLGYQVEALHCNFMLRGEESVRDERFVSQLCQQINVPLHIKTFDTRAYSKANKISIEMGARELRYQWFEEMRQASNAQTICVAHHQNDQAETILLNLIRGTGLRGLAGMHYRNGNIVRPLLDCSRKDIEKYLTDNALKWVDDSTNFEREALRNCIRLDVLPLLQSLNPQAIRNLSRTAAIVQDSLPIYERGLHTQIDTSSNGTVEISIQSPTELHESIVGYGFTSTQEKNIWEAQQGKLVETSTHRLLKDRGRYLLRDKTYEAPMPHLTYKTMKREDISKMTSNNLYLDKEKVKEPLQVRKCKNGDRIDPFGMKGSKLVSDLLTDMKLNKFEKEDQYVLTDADGDILWIIGRRASNKYRVTENTKEVLCIETGNPQKQ